MLNRFRRSFRRLSRQRRRQTPLETPRDPYHSLEERINLCTDEFPTRNPLQVVENFGVELLVISREEQSDHPEPRMEEEHQLEQPEQEQPQILISREERASEQTSLPDDDSTATNEAHAEHHTAVQCAGHSIGAFVPGIQVVANVSHALGNMSHDRPGTVGDAVAPVQPVEERCSVLCIVSQPLLGDRHSLGRQPHVIDCNIKCPLVDCVPVLATFDHNGGILSSEYGDVKVITPKGAIRHGDLVTIYVASSIFSYDQFMFSYNHNKSDLISSFCWIGASYQFSKPVLVEIDVVALIDDPEHCSLLSCEDDTDSVMRPVYYDYNFEVRESGSVCMFETTHFCSYCLLYDLAIDTKSIRTVGVYAYQSEIKNGVDDILTKLCFFIPLKECVERIRRIHQGKHMNPLKPISSKLFFVSYRKIREKRYEFCLSHADEVDGWDIDSDKCDKINVARVNFFDGHYGSAKALEQAEEDGTFPASYTVNVDPTGRKKGKLTTLLTVALFNRHNDKRKQSESFILKIDMRLYPISLIRPEPVGTSASCKENVNKIKKYHDKLSKLKYKEISSLLRSYGVITSDDMESIDSMPRGSDKMHYLLETVLIRSLECDVQVKYNGFLKALEESEDSVANSLAKHLDK